MTTHTNMLVAVAALAGFGATFFVLSMSERPYDASESAVESASISESSSATTSSAVPPAGPDADIAAPQSTKEPDPAEVAEQHAIRNMANEVERCSIRSNESGLPGPVKLRITTNDSAYAVEVTVLSEEVLGTDLEKCLEVTADPFNGKHLPIVTFTHTFEFHPWASRSRHKWSEVKRLIEDAGIVTRLQKCVDSVVDPKNPEGKEELWFTIRNDGTLLSRTIRSIHDEMQACLNLVLDDLPTLNPVGNNYWVTLILEWGEEMPLKFEGVTAAPSGCQTEGYPCTSGEVDPEMTKWAKALMKRTIREKQPVCGKMEEVAAWLRQQEHVEGVGVGRCAFRLYVKDTGPIWFMASHH